MAEQIVDPKKSRESGPGTDDTTEYAPSKAPETREHAEDRSSDDVHDDRLLPGGRHGASADVGMSGIDRSAIPGGADSPRQADFGERRPRKLD